MRAVLDGMLTAGGGTIVNVSSGAAHRPMEGWSAYCAGKAGLAMVTRSIMLETAGKGIRIFGFSPGTIDTDMQVKICASGINPVSQIPRGDLAPVEHAVRGLLYLCTSASDDLIGQDVSIRDEAVRRRVGERGPRQPERSEGSGAASKGVLWSEHDNLRFAQDDRMPSVGRRVSPSSGSR